MPEVRLTSIDVKPIRDVAEFIKGLPIPQPFKELLDIPVFNTDDIKDTVKKIAPIDGREVVEWMQETLAANMVLFSLQNDIENAGGVFRSGAGDGYVPGVRVGNLYFKSDRGTVVRRRGYAIVRGNNIPDIKVPIDTGKLVFLKNKLIALLGAFNPRELQFNGFIALWEKLPRTPINARLRFGIIQKIPIPQFIHSAPRIPAPAVINRIGISSEKQQRINIKGRRVDRPSEVVYEDTVTVPSGQSEVMVQTASFPLMPPVILQITPESPGKLTMDYVDTIP